MAIRGHHNKFLDWAIYLHELEAHWLDAHLAESQDTGAASPAAAVADAAPLFSSTEASADQPQANADDVLSLLESRLHDPDPKVRLEVARRLGEAGDADGTQALVALLQDDSHEVRWAAMHSLIQLEREAVHPLLEALTQDFQSANLRQGAHHVFRALHEQGALNGSETQVFRALEGAAPAVQAAWAANNALIERMESQ